LTGPDYSKPPKALYADLTVEWVGYYRCLDIVYASQWRLPGSGGLSGLAMWVPDVGYPVSLCLLVSGQKCTFQIREHYLRKEFLVPPTAENRMNGEIIESVGGEEEIARKVTSDIF
jgi:hypothetical protein